MKFSVITVSFNSASTLKDTLISVATQVNVDIEHLVIDGASTDLTHAVLAQYGDHVARFVSEPDCGIYDAMNKGISLASGDVIGFLNADDIYADNQVLSRIARVFQRPEIEACYGDLIYVTKDNHSAVRHWKSRSFSLGSFAYGWSPAHPTFYIRRSALQRMGNFDLSYKISADVEFMMRYLEVGCIRSEYIPHVQVRMRVGGVSNKNLTNIYYQNLDILKALNKHKIPYSLIKFILFKLTNRFLQRWSGLRLEPINRHPPIQ